ncbi:MAG: hypothetical protein PHQ00_05470 [Phycisphaerae bacterium]|nr:hypothetical protein [Phycisphaerae bacterium]
MKEVFNVEFMFETLGLKHYGIRNAATGHLVKDGVYGFIACFVIKSSAEALAKSLNRTCHNLPS